MRFSLTTSLLPLALLFGAVGCYKNIPAALVDPILTTCRVVRETNMASSSTPRPFGTTSEQLMINGQAVTVYSTDPHEYRYDLHGLLAHERTKYGQIYQDTEFTYTSGKLSMKTVNSNAAGAITDVYSVTALLNDQGYYARYNYDADGVLIQPTYAFSEKRVDGNPIQELIDDDGRIVTLNYTYDSTRLSMPSPRQFEGKRSRNLMLTQSSSGFHCCKASHSEYRYQFDSQGRVSRQIGIRWDGELPDGSPPVAVYVTDYEYECR